LLMSDTAQRKDIYDRDVIAAFADSLKNKKYLDYLYLLTIADICATNPKLWNSWKDSLLIRLYQATKAYLGEEQKPINKSTLIQMKKDDALVRLKDSLDPDRIKALWLQLGVEYFLREDENAIAWHTQGILMHQNKSSPLILLRNLKEQGATELFIYTRDKDALFAAITAILDRCHLNIVEARIMTSLSGYSLDTFMVLNEFNKLVTEPSRLERIETLLNKYLGKNAPFPTYSQRRIPSHLRHFQYKTRVRFHTNHDKNRTEMTVITSDRPGLLARIGRAFVDCCIRLQNAKINTLGDRVEDVFYITDLHNKPLMDRKKLKQIREAICTYIEEKT